ncbi:MULTISPECIES: peroxiredoxin-like family protein [unclassified Mesorhizobium]|uniref:peroxiredoxin-like family protein n=1 Tax=unclassified Mesorhizobium TaxID=325217 RepID=UPI000BAE8F4E|nr:MULTISPECIES: peroxiredoxin-like family protein [unclassified Mesorhizobium]PBC19200.1 alkyl hydroperoxide reductase [Mesorhizobium sp. WSM4311]TRD00081.1 AhpC/TSA family protein [Mesorhizobium sp. WSM4305]
MSLQDKLDAFKADFESKKAPRQAVEIMHRATAELLASGQAARALGVGAVAPTFTLMEADGGLVSSADLLALGPLVLSFYRGVWCPYCNIELGALEETWPAINATGAQLVSISPQSPANGRKAKRDKQVTFPMLSDPNGEVASNFGLRFRLPDDLIALYKSFGVDLPAINEDPSWTLPMPARFVIRRDGIIVYAEVSPDYTIRPDPAGLLPLLKRLQNVVTV